MGNEDYYEQNRDPDRFLLRHSQSLAEKYGIDIMSFHIMLDGTDYVERVSCTNEEFYGLMRQAKGVPSTAAITPIQFCEKYCEYVDAGYTDVVHISINRTGSSTYDNAVMAQGMLRKSAPSTRCGSTCWTATPIPWCLAGTSASWPGNCATGAELRHVLSEFEDQMAKMESSWDPTACAR